MLLYKQKKTQNAKGNRFLISITVLGSAGPIRFVVNEEALVAAVIDTALKSYAREGRLPVLGSDLDEFMLYCPTAGPDGNFPFCFLLNIQAFVLLLMILCVNFIACSSESMGHNWIARISELYAMQEASACENG